uniref:UDP-N-acetylglucosamine--peptide N-acetylglucosaminyltransferase SPINDLY n=1 Tax=Rhodosorus marinus TaxID=101924 RepID=A0A7S0BRM3_9RHOD|mmetsp:Transcript_5580/g.7831  ORF Transcript_5580/g.7831 Transcript_5580/m.7831 type:complete len:637 (+) Transcript_5580:643-2553(+)
MQEGEDLERKESSDESDIDDVDFINYNVYEDMVDLPPSDEDIVYGWTDLRNKQLKSALVGACKRMPRNTEAHFHLGLMFLRNGKGTEALKAFQHCMRLYNESLSSYKHEEPPRGLQRNIARLQTHIALASSLDAENLASADEKSKLLKDLQELLLEATNKDATRPDVWNSLALLHLLEGGEMGSREILKSILESFPDYLDGLNNLGLAESALGNEKEARRCFQEVVLRDRGHVEALSNYGVLLVQHGMFEHAASLFQDALSGTKESRGLPFALCGLAISRAGLGQLEEAENAAREAERTTVVPRDRLRMSMLVQSIMARRGADENIQRLESSGAVSESASQTPPRRPKTRALKSASGPTDFQASLENAENSKVAEAVSAKNARNTLDVAVSRLRGLSRELSTAPASTALGMALRLRHENSIEETGNRSFGAEAAERLVEALEKSKSDASAWSQLSLLQIGSGEYSSAREFALQACARNETLPAAWNTLGVTSQLVDELEDAEKAYIKALGAALARESYIMDGEGLNDMDRKEVSYSGLTSAATIWNNLGNLWRQEGTKFDEAQDAYDKSLLAGGAHSVVYNNLALLYISIGRLDEAEHMLNRALQLNPNRECAISNKLKLKVLRKMRAPETKIRKT